MAVAKLARTDMVVTFTRFESYCYMNLLKDKVNCEFSNSIRLSYAAKAGYLPSSYLSQVLNTHLKRWPSCLHGPDGVGA